MIPFFSGTTKVLSEGLNTIFFSTSQSFFSGPTQVTFFTLKPFSKIYYTIDGSDPTLNSYIYNGDLQISKTTIIKAQVFTNTSPSGYIFTKAIFVNEKLNLPVISLVTDPKNLFDPKIGIYVKGESYEEGVTSSANFGKRGAEYIRPVHFTLFEKNGTQAVSLHANMSIYGARTRFNPDKSLKICGKGPYAQNLIRYKLISQIDQDTYNCFLIRTSGNDWSSTLIRDNMMQDLVHGLGFETQHARPIVLYINGQYWGIHNLQQFYDDNFFKYKYDIDPNAISIIQPERSKGGVYIVDEGQEQDAQNFEDLMAFIGSVKEEDRKKDAFYEDLSKRMDIQAYINYFASEIYFANNDWLDTNIKYWRVHPDRYQSVNTDVGDGRWRPMLYDTDGGFGLNKSWDQHQVNTLDFSTSSFYGLDWPTKMFRRLLVNERFKQEFILTFSNLLNTRFEEKNALNAIDNRKYMIQSEIPNHINRWGGQEDLQGYKVFDTPEQWESNIEFLRNFARNRPDAVRSHIVEKFKLNGTAKVNIDFNNKDAGYILVNNIVYKDCPCEITLFQDLPNTFEAVSHSGYKFLNWEGALIGAEQSTSTVLLEDTSIKVNFTKE